MTDKDSKDNWGWRKLYSRDDFRVIEKLDESTGKVDEIIEDRLSEFDWSEIWKRLNTKRSIEIIWCVLGGLLFSISPKMFTSHTFHLFLWWQDFFEIGFGGYFDEFLFGFFVTLILIWSIKVYKKLP